jgi:hypothetical protein
MSGHNYKRDPLVISNYLSVNQNHSKILITTHTVLIYSSPIWHQTARSIVQNDSTKILGCFIIHQILTISFNFYEMIIIVSIQESKPFFPTKFQRNFDLFEIFVQMKFRLFDYSLVLYLRKYENPSLIIFSIF